MFWIACNAFVVFLAIIGLVELVRIAILKLLKINCEGLMWVLVPMYGHNEEAEMLLRTAATRVEWSLGMKGQRVICLDAGMDKETRSICEIICSQYNFMEIYTPDDFMNYIENPKV